MTAERLGTVIAGKYRVQEVLGRGGMGDVYSGIDEELGGKVAVKFLHRMFGNDSDLRARFRREAQALSRLRHPGIVSLLQFGEHEEELFVVMELVTGKALSDLIDEAPLSVPFVATVFSELFEILEFAHEAGVVHRDVKPSNVMVLPGNRVKLIDFGLARLPETQEKLTRAGVVHGTPEYMSPEQALGENVDAPGDIYSTGVLLYECLAGDGPFEGGSAAMLMSQHLFGDPPPMRTRGHKREIPKSLEALVRRAMAKKAADRPTAAAMRAELIAFLKGTDSVTLVERGVEARQRDALHDREERALTGRPPAALSEAVASGVVAIRIGEARQAAIRTALGARGISSYVDGEIAGAGALLVDDMAAIRRDLPVLVMEIDGIANAVSAIRAGASDIAMNGTSDAEIAGQVVRLLRRKR